MTVFNRRSTLLVILCTSYSLLLEHRIHFFPRCVHTRVGLLPLSMLPLYSPDLHISTRWYIPFLPRRSSMLLRIKCDAIRIEPVTRYMRSWSRRTAFFRYECHDTMAFDIDPFWPGRPFNFQKCCQVTFRFLRAYARSLSISSDADVRLRCR